MYYFGFETFRDCFEFGYEKMSNRRRGLDMGVLLLGYELMMNNNIPPVTLVAILAQIGIFLGFVPMLDFENIRKFCF